jgi:secreted trypsin-like serine protease
LCLIPVVGSAQTRSNIIVVPGGTQVPIHVVGTVSSASLKDGDTFQFQAAQDVVVNGMIVVRSGSLGSGTIHDVDHAGGNGHSGSLTLNFDWIYAVDGGRIHLASATQKQAEEDRKGASSTATIIGFATFGLGGLFGHNLAHGREVTVDEKKILNAFVADNVHVAATERAQREDHFDH